MASRALGLFVYSALAAILLLATAQLSQFRYASKKFNLVKDRHSYGYLLRETRQIKLAVSTGKILFYYALPERNPNLDSVQVNCTSVEALEQYGLRRQGNATDMLWRRVCPDVTNLLSSFHLAKLDALNLYTRTMNQVYEMVPEVTQATPTQARRRRGAWSDGWAWVTGLPSREDLNKLQQQLDAIAPALRTASETWASGTAQFTTAIKIQRQRVNTLFELLNITRADIRTFNSELLDIIGQEDLRTSLIGLVMNTLKKTIFQVSQLDSLYHAIEDLVRHQLSHYIISHSDLTRALYALQNHLTHFEPDLQVAELDAWFYFTWGEFKVFRYRHYLVINLRVPLTTRTLAYKFSVFKLIKVPLAGPEINDSHYTELQTDIASIVYSPMSSQYVVIKQGQKQIHDLIWLLPESSFNLQSRSVKTCATSLLTAELNDIKKLCGYRVVYKLLPSSAIRLSTDRILVSNEKRVMLRCNALNFAERLNKTEIQYIVHINCFCSLEVGSFVFINEALNCENSTDANGTNAVTVWFMLNIPYLSVLFPNHWVVNIDPDLLLNQSVIVEIPDLLVNSKRVKNLMIGDGNLNFDLEQVLNHTLKSESVYNSMSDYLFDMVARSKNIGEGLNVFSWLTWMQFIIGFVLIVNLIWTIIIHFRVRAICILLPAIPRAAAYPKLIYYLPTEPSQNAQDDSVDYKEILRVLKIYVPVELILLSLMILVAVTLAIWVVVKRVNRGRFMTSLYLEVGNNNTSVYLLVGHLKHTPSYYRINIFLDKVLLQLKDFYLFGELRWTGLVVTHTLLETRISLDYVKKVWGNDLRTLRRLMTETDRYYALFHVLEGEQTVEILLLKNFTIPPTSGLSLYPVSQLQQFQQSTAIIEQQL